MFNEPGFNNKVAKMDNDKLVVIGGDAVGMSAASKVRREQPEREIVVANAGIKLGAGDAIQVNKRMETSVPEIWAAGDCAESFHLITQKQVHIALDTVASKHGRVAGSNISGGNEAFPGVLGTAITTLSLPMHHPFQLSGIRYKSGLMNIT